MPVVTPPTNPTPPAPPVPPVTYTGVSFTATVLAGKKPLVGASLTLYAAGTTGNGSAATNLVSGGVTTNASGVATIPATYDCPSSSSLLYLVSRGGSLGVGGAANGSAELVTMVGPCGNVTTSTSVTIDEATTVADVYALAQFYSPANGFGASATNATGLANAVATAATLADPATGAAPGPTMPANAVAPSAQVNTLANLVNACVVSATACSGLFSAVPGEPANTLDAVYDLARAPSSSVAALYALAQTSTAYAPALSKAPTDWTLFITYSGGGLDLPSGIGVDSTGSVWVSNYFAVASKFSPIGAPVFSSGITGDGLNDSYGLAIDLSDDVWIPNEQPYTGQGTGSVSEISPAGTALSGAGGYTAGGLNFPISVAIDPNGTTWVVDYGNSSLTLLNASGVPVSNFASTDFAFPVVVAVDGNHFGWVGNLGDSFITKVASDGSSLTHVNCCDGATGIAIDQVNNVWVANFYSDSVSLVANSGTVISNQGYTGLGSLSRPQGIAVDGAGNVWVANYRASYLTELAAASASSPGASLSPAQGLGADAGLLEAFALAIDASGNLWVSNQGSDTITRFIGLAAPVKTPLSGIPAAP